ncbi:putative aminoacyltransferase, E1 ubiquitin-activating enzyme [Rosa chinensis]|uniref:protein-disulfide reductase n=1 Tax=Rosa chinensis TaxID=74649 RepID=A0A2P6PJT9_ROSCH|nr:putative aminoacyltransferase, E1 ubiquitin-activating enzyme [Rosa chinensis]
MGSNNEREKKSKEFIDLGKENDILSSIGSRSSRDYKEQISKLEAVAQRQAGSGDLIVVCNINYLISLCHISNPWFLSIYDDFKTTNKEEFKLPGFDEFRRSISFDLMKDPVIVASGHTHDGNFIAQWINSEHQTCPKSGQKLIHMALVPNYALKSLLHQLCEENNSLVSHSRDFVIAFGGKKVHDSKLEGKMAGLYLLSTYSPYTEFTPKLMEIYEKLKAKVESFEIIFISLNDAEEAFKQDFKNMPWFALGQNDIKTCDKLTRDSELSTSPILVIIGADGKTIHNNVAEAIEDVDGKVYDFPVIMQLVMVMEFSSLSFVKNDNSSRRMEVFEKKKGYMVIGYDITHEKATINIVKVHAKKAFDEKWVAKIARKIVMVMTNESLYTTTYTEVITGICKTLQLSEYEIRNSDGLLLYLMVNLLDIFLVLSLHQLL